MFCQICGKNSGFYPLCIDCNKLKEDGEVTKCGSCGKWKKNDKPLCYGCWSNENKSIENAPPNKGLNETECEMCGNNSDGKSLCHDCWLKSKNIKNDVKAPSTNDNKQIKHTSQNFREKHKEGLTVRTKHGVPVRSRIEKIILEFLTDNGIIVQYEKSLFLGDQEFYPDFYLQDYDIYLEHWGSDEPGYVEKRRKKEEIYKKHNLQYFSTEESDVDNIEDKLKSELSKYGINTTKWK